jgi:diguanylate cyclase (GGDEF)-like protein
MVNLQHIYVAGNEFQEVMSSPMQPFVTPGLLHLQKFSFTPALIGRVEPQAHVLPQSFFSLLFVLFSTSGIFSLHHIEDAFIGLSCIAIAATLASFLINSGHSIPFRWPLTALTVCTTIAGLCSLLSAALHHDLHPRLTSLSPLFGAVLAIFAACLLPLLLPYLLSRSRELALTSVTARKCETRFLAATQSCSDAFILLDALRSPGGIIEDFLFTYINHNAEKIIDKPSSEVVGARITRILPIESNGRLFRQYQQVVATGKPLVHEFPLDPKDPDGPWMRHHVAKLVGDDEDGLAITASDITERKHAEQDHLHLSQHDPVTGLPNRRLLDDRIQQAIARADRYRNKVAVFLINLDGFEQVTARYGADFGDQVLLATASRLRKAIRATDSILRLGGDEFVVLMPDMILEIDVRRAAATLVAILREPLTIEKKKPSLQTAAQSKERASLESEFAAYITTQTIQISTSLGVSIYPDSALTVDDLLIQADIAMYRAKTQGSNQYVLYAPAADLTYNSDSYSEQYAN